MDNSSMKSAMKLVIESTKTSEIIHGILSSMGRMHQRQHHSFYFPAPIFFSRIAFVLRQPVSVHDYSNSIFRSASPRFGYVSAYFKVFPRHCLPQYMNREVTAFCYAGFWTNKYQITNMQYRQGKTHATFGLPYKTGENSIRKSISVIWDLEWRMEGVANWSVALIKAAGPYVAFWFQQIRSIEVMTAGFSISAQRWGEQGSGFAQFFKILAPEIIVIQLK